VWCPCNENTACQKISFGISKNTLTGIYDDSLADRYGTYQHLTLFVGRDLDILSRPVVFQQDDSTQHTARHTEDSANLFYWEILEPSSSACHMFGPLTQQLGCHRFHDSDEEEMAVREWSRMQGPDSATTERLNLSQDEEKCTKMLADYVQN
jgi:hypothetical protein